MKTIYKYKLEPGYTELNLPKNAEILMVNVQNDKAFIWAEVDKDAEEELRHFVVAGTGHALPTNKKQHIGSFLMDEGMFVFHAFELLD